jgi:cephalosporin-C deacetylase-like acetyl esterase
MKPPYFSPVLTNIIWLNIFVLKLGILTAQSTAVNSAVDQKPTEPENLNVFQDWIQWNNPGSMRTHYLNSLAAPYYDIRDKAIARLHNKNDWAERQRLMKQKITEAIGSFPEKTPLNARITSIIHKEQFRIEKIVFESWPGFYVTGCLFIPQNIQGKLPAVLNLIGHEQHSYHEPLDQVIIQNLVRKGMIVFSIDPLGQGEHVQYFEPGIKFSSIGYSVIEHSYFGNICFLTGTSPAKYFIRDGIRAIDYLVSRPEVDAGRIGVTGFSGGGTITNYIAAIDPRVKVSIPSSWSNACRSVSEMKGTQDAETFFIHGLQQGISAEDLIEARAPAPTLMTFTTRDEYLSLQGARNTYKEAKKAYEVLGAGDQLQLVEDDSKHWLTPKIRLAMYSFFMKHFHLSGNPNEVEAEKLQDEELTVTTTGQISTSLGGKTVYDLNKAACQSLMDSRIQSRKNISPHLTRVKEMAKKISGYKSPCCNDAMPVINGRYQRDGYTITKYALPGEGDYAIPLLLFEPAEMHTNHKAIIYLHEKGKAIEAKADGEIELLVRNGYTVAAADVLGVGETASTATRGMADGNTGILIGRSMIGIQAGDIIRVANYIKHLHGVDSDSLGAIGIGALCIPLLHAAALDASIKYITLIGSLISYNSVVMNKFYKIGLTPREGGGYHHPYEVDFNWGIAGVLQAYDLPDLMACIAPRKLVLVDLKNELLENASEELKNQELEFPLTVYKEKGVAGNMRIVDNADHRQSLYQFISN